MTNGGTGNTRNPDIGSQRARKFKKVQAKKTREIKYINFTEKVFKLPEMQFHEKKFY